MCGEGEVRLSELAVVEVPSSRRSGASSPGRLRRVVDEGAGWRRLCGIDEPCAPLQRQCAAAVREEAATGELSMIMIMQAFTIARESFLPAAEAIYRVRGDVAAEARGAAHASC
jgi:hypothetical protein